MGAGKTRCSLVVDLALSGPTNWRRSGGGPCTVLSPGLKSGGLESKFGQGPGPLDRRVMGWSCLCLGYKRACVSGYLAGHIDSRITGVLVRLVYSLAP